MLEVVENNGSSSVVPSLLAGDQLKDATHGRIEEIFLLVACIVSVASCLVAFYLYRRYTAMRRHPSRLLMYRVVCDALFSIVVCVNLDIFVEEDFCKGVLGGCIAFAAEFLIIGSEVWCLTLSIDLLLSFSRPFWSFSKNRRAYKILFFSVSSMLAVTLVVTNTFGKSSFGFCWIKSTHGLEGLEPIQLDFFSTSLLQ